LEKGSNIERRIDKRKVTVELGYEVIKGTE